MFFGGTKRRSLSRADRECESYEVKSALCFDGHWNFSCSVLCVEIDLFGARPPTIQRHDMWYVCEDLVQILKFVTTPEKQPHRQF